MMVEHYTRFLHSRSPFLVFLVHAHMVVTRQDIIGRCVR